MRKVYNYIYVIALVLINSLAFADCEILNTSFFPEYKESTPKADNAFIFLIVLLIWRDLFEKMKSIYQKLITII